MYGFKISITVHVPVCCKRDLTSQNKAIFRFFIAGNTNLFFFVYLTTSAFSIE